MCGIVGIFGSPDNNNVKVFESLLKLDVLRGEDSTGLVAVYGEHVKHIKELGETYHLLWGEEYLNTIKTNNKNPNLLLGHNRHATKGNISIENAHPFNYDPISMVHNGTLIAHNDLVKELGVEFESDSEALCYAIAIFGIEKVWKNLKGAASVVWYDSAAKSLCMIRNDQRPLKLVFSKNNRHLYFASESWMLDAISNRYNIVADKIISLKPNYFHEFKIINNTLTCEYKELEEYTYVNNLMGYWDKVAQKWISYTKKRA